MSELGATRAKAHHDLLCGGLGVAWQWSCPRPLASRDSATSVLEKLFRGGWRRKEFPSEQNRHGHVFFLNMSPVEGSGAAWGRTFIKKVLVLKKPLVPGSFAAWGLRHRAARYILFACLGVYPKLLLTEKW